MDNEHQENSELAKKYIDNQLAEEQLEAVAKKVKEDADFAKELAFQMAMKKAFEMEEVDLEEDIQEILQSEEKERIVADNQEVIPPKETPVRQIAYWKYIVPIAASILLAAFWFLNQPTPRAQTAKAFLTEASANAEPQNLLGSFDLGQALEEENYPAIIDWARESRAALNNKCKNNVANYYLGTLSLYTQTEGKPAKETIDTLECVYNKYGADYPDMPIHLARAYWYNGDRAKAKAMVELIQTSLPEDLQDLQN